LKEGGKFNWRMEEKDGSMGFGYSGTYDSIIEFKSIEKRLDDGRRVKITFEELEGCTKITEEFEPDENNPELQKQGWQAILKKFVENV